MMKRAVFFDRDGIVNIRIVGDYVKKVEELGGNMGYNALTGKYEDMVKAGIIDPKKVTRIALQNAASIASLMITTEALIAEKPEEKKSPSIPPSPYGGADMM